MDVSEKCELCKMQVKFWKGSDNYIDKEISRCNNIFGTREFLLQGPKFTSCYRFDTELFSGENERS